MSRAPPRCPPALRILRLPSNPREKSITASPSSAQPRSSNMRGPFQVLALTPDAVDRVEFLDPHGLTIFAVLNDFHIVSELAGPDLGDKLGLFQGFERLVIVSV